MSRHAIEYEFSNEMNDLEIRMKIKEQNDANYDQKVIEINFRGKNDDNTIECKISFEEFLEYVNVMKKISKILELIIRPRNNYPYPEIEEDYERY
ncbi:MAG: hypothetical protein ACTSRP_25975 [Candidatus Helarchaeota archaeon]